MTSPTKAKEQFQPKPSRSDWSSILAVDEAVRPSSHGSRIKTSGTASVVCTGLPITEIIGISSTDANVLRDYLREAEGR